MIFTFHSKLICSMIALSLSCIIHTDPIMFLKNNSDRRISVEPLAANTTFRPVSIAPENDENSENNEYKVESTGEPLTGVRIQYCPSAAGASCNIDEAAFNQASKKSTTFYFDAPKAKKYYVKLTIDKNDKVSLEAQAGRLGRTSDLKYSLSDNIKTTEIKSTPPRPQQASPVRPVAPKVGVSTPTLPMIEQEAVLDANINWRSIIAASKRLEEIHTELKNIQLVAAKKDVTRNDVPKIESRFDKVTKQYTDLKDEIARAPYQLMPDETALAEEVDYAFTRTKNAIAKLRDFLKMPQGGEYSSLGTPPSETGLAAISSQDMSTEERQKMLQAIKTLAPELYNLILQVDPTGEKHIKKDHYNKTLVSVRPAWDTGLPIIGIGAIALAAPQKEMLFVIGHELSHYVLGHKLDEYHYDYAPGDLLAKARNRLRENECDRMSILEFGNSIDDGIAAIQSWMQESKEYAIQDPHKKTFKDTHPLSADRIRNLESLRSEAELTKARSRQRTPIDWKKLVEDYKKAASPQPVDAALVQKYVNKTYTQAELENYINKVNLTYERVGQKSDFPQADKNRRGKPWTTDTIADFLSLCLYSVDESIKKRHLTDVQDEEQLAYDVLYAYYSAKLFASNNPNNQEIKALSKGTLEELLNKSIAGKSIAQIIQKFEQ